MNPLRFPLNPEKWVEFTIPTLLTAAEWARMVAILQMMKPGFMESPPEECSTEETPPEHVPPTPPLLISKAPDCPTVMAKILEMLQEGQSQHQTSKDIKAMFPNVSRLSVTDINHYAKDWKRLGLLPSPDPPENEVPEDDKQPDKEQRSSSVVEEVRVPNRDCRTATQRQWDQHRKLNGG